MRIYLSTGEISGEQHAGRLAKALRARVPELALSGMGSDLLANAGVEIIANSASIRVMGFWDVLTHLPAIRKAFRAAIRHIRATRPDAVVLVDYPGFHLRLAQAIKRKCPGIPVIQYIAPKVWAWNEGRVVKIRKAYDLVLSILPFEEEWFAKHEIWAAYVGNPVADAVREADGKKLREELGITPEEKLISIFPGSRRKELHAILPAMLDAGRILEGRHEKLAFAVAAAPGFSREQLSQIVPLPGALPVVEGRSLELLAASDIVMAKSGTTTLEAALLRKPMVVAYRTGRINAFLARMLMKLKHFSLPNIILQKEAVKELFQEAACGTRIADEISQLLYNTRYREQMLLEFAALSRKLGTEPAADRAAKAILGFLQVPEPVSSGPFTDDK